jgi:Trk-type K+ transport system membrane component
MPSPANNSPASRQSFWSSIARIVLVEILLLVVLSGAVVGYLNWSSEAAWAEFKAASESATPAPNAPVQTVKGHMSCDRKA